MSNQPDRPFGFDTRIPQEIRTIFQALAIEVLRLDEASQVYFGLFGDEDSANKVLKVANQTFKVINSALRVEVILSIARLSDPLSTGKEKREHKNITLKTLNSYFNPTDPIFEKIREFETACDPFRTIRNKTLAHMDMETILDGDKLPIPDFKKVEMIKGVFGIIKGAQL